METGFDFRSHRDLEQYLQDLVCEVGSLAEVGLLVEVLMELQQRAPMNESVNSRAASSAAGE
jgi:hypothetical protein